MLRQLAVSSLAVVGLLTVATAPAEAGRRTGTWKYWNPYVAQAAPPHWQRPHSGGYAGRGYRHPGYHGYRGGYGGYSPSPYGHAYGYRRRGDDAFEPHGAGVAEHRLASFGRQVPRPVTRH